MTILRHLEDPPASLAGPDTLSFLRTLSGPTALSFAGRDCSRTRVMATLLHGNEPSGAHAVRRWITAQLQPATDLVLIVASLEAALTEPVFSHRMLPGHRDLNRCFRAPYEGAEGRLAKAILDLIDDLQPEAVIDMHNTSGSGPAFGVCPHRDLQHEALVSLFAPRMVISGLRLGALMERTDTRTPTVTVEVGGRLDEASHALAWEGLQRFALEERILALPGQTDWGMEIFEGSVRLELRPAVRLAYAARSRADVDVTLRPDIERFNFGRVAAGTPLGWSSAAADSLFSARDLEGRDCLHSLISVEEGVLVTTQPLRFFMVTSHPEIARSDCLLYAVCDVDPDSGCSA